MRSKLIRPPDCRAEKNRNKYRCVLCGLTWPLDGAHPGCREAGDGRLSPQELKLFNKLESGEIPIRLLYRTLTKRWPPPTMQNRVQQSYISPWISRLNAKLARNKLRAVPGISRNSYRLIDIRS